MRIVKGDQVIVRSGKYKGHKDEVVTAFPATGRVIVKGVNVAKKHAKATRATMQGGVIDKFMPMPVSAVSLVCKSCGEATRVGVDIDENGRKIRICKKCGAEQ
jgi:large subunit ribosomal protein L24